MEFTVSLGNIITLIAIVVGFVWQHFSLVERIAVLETKVQRNIEDIEKLYEILKEVISIAKQKH